MLLTEFSEVMLSKNTAFGSGSLPSSSSELLVLDESLVSSSWSYKWISWPWYCGTLYDFMHLFETFLYAYLLQVPCFLAVRALSMRSRACCITAVFISASETTSEFEFQPWLAGRWITVLKFFVRATVL